MLENGVSAQKRLAPPPLHPPSLSQSTCVHVYGLLCVRTSVCVCVCVRVCVCACVIAYMCVCLRVFDSARVRARAHMCV